MRKGLNGVQVSKIGILPKETRIKSIKHKLSLDVPIIGLGRR